MPIQRLPFSVGGLRVALRSSLVIADEKWFLSFLNWTIYRDEQTPLLADISLLFFFSCSFLRQFCFARNLWVTLAFSLFCRNITWTNATIAAVYFSQEIRSFFLFVEFCAHSAHSLHVRCVVYLMTPQNKLFTLSVRETNESVQNCDQAIVEKNARMTLHRHRFIF